MAAVVLVYYGSCGLQHSHHCDSGSRLVLTKTSQIRPRYTPDWHAYSTLLRFQYYKISRAQKANVKSHTFSAQYVVTSPAGKDASSAPNAATFSVSRMQFNKK